MRGEEDEDYGERETEQVSGDGDRAAKGRDARGDRGGVALARRGFGVFRALATAIGEEERRERGR